jgi:hypothetical protein
VRTALGAFRWIIFTTDLFDTQISLMQSRKPIVMQFAKHYACGAKSRLQPVAFKRMRTS